MTLEGRMFAQEVAQATFFDAVEDHVILLMGYHYWSDLANFIRHTWIRYGGRVRFAWLETDQGPVLVCDLLGFRLKTATFITHRLTSWLKRNDCRITVTFRYYPSPIRPKRRKKRRA